MVYDNTRPAPVTDVVRSRMASQRRESTAPELALRRALHRRGLRFRVGYKVPNNARRTIDIAFTRKRLAVFVDGCFWHRCPEHSVPAKNNHEWWQQKLSANVARDRQTTALLIQQGWQVIRAWEHEDPEDVADRVAHLLSSVRN